jgi:hypothetical protein
MDSADRAANKNVQKAYVSQQLQKQYVDTINLIEHSYLKQLYQYAAAFRGDVVTYINLDSAMNAKTNTEHIIFNELKHMYQRAAQMKVQVEVKE